VRVAAVIVSWNSGTDLPACLLALDAQDHDDLEVVVVDNASRDPDTLDVLAAIERAEPRHPVRVVRNRSNRGFSGGVNDALAGLTDEVTAVLLVNPDVVVAPDLVRRCVAALSVAEDLGSVQPTLHRPLVDAAGEPVIDTTGHELTSARLVRNRDEGRAHRHGASGGEVFGASGACVLHRRAMLDDVAWRRTDGGLEVLTEDLVAYFDDVELDWRARCLGWRAVHEPSALGVHERGGAGARRTPTVEALNWSNRLLVLATCDRPGWRDLPLIVVTTGLKTLELALTTPRALPPAIARLRLLPRARRRRAQLLARARVSPEAVAWRWVVPFDWGAWVTTWWRRVRGRPPGEAVGPAPGRGSP
jgi:GT2 family glycosyltransferase